jgi:hypothetical protein
MREAQKHVDPVDPDPESDPQHWKKSTTRIRIFYSMVTRRLRILITLMRIRIHLFPQESEFFIL